MKQLSIGLDGGHSMFKVRAAFTDTPDQRMTFQIPTAVIPAIALSNERAKQQAQGDTVQMQNASYFVGDTALRQGQLACFTGQTANWVESIEHDVLILGAWEKVMAAVGKSPTRIQLVLGLPAKFYDSQKAKLRKRVTDLVVPRLANGQVLKVSVQSQAEAPLQWLSIKSDGSINPERNVDNEKWGVIEIGHFTTDFSLSDRGTMIETVASSCSGMFKVYDSVARELTARDLPTSVEDVERAVRDQKFVTPFETIDLAQVIQKAQRGFVSEVLDHAGRVFDAHKRMLHGIVVAGGGAPLLISALKEKYKQCHMGEEPRHVVSEGFCRVGLAQLKFQQ